MFCIEICVFIFVLLRACVCALSKFFISFIQFFIWVCRRSNRHQRVHIRLQIIISRMHITWKKRLKRCPKQHSVQPVRAPQQKRMQKPCRKFRVTNKQTTEMKREKKIPAVKIFWVGKSNTLSLSEQ